MGTPTFEGFPSRVNRKRVISSLFLVAIYGAIFTGVLLSNTLRGIPDERHGLDLDEAYYNLHQIATQPHPVNSHANDLARDYILAYLRNATAEYEHVEIVDDLTSNITWVANSGHGVSFEGSNVLVKIAGTDSNFVDKGGVLFSAHFDSVPTGPGVTDDGMGVVTLMELIRYLATHRTKRTAIFNINNGEEDGLKGAFAFLHHPWFKIPDTFFNLEGAAAGGRPIVFRSTSLAPVLSFKDKNVLHPHGNVLSADAFSRQVIKSRTDYSVYEYGIGDGPGMEGIDFAFYQGRSSYHTKYDSIPGAKGGRRALWAMMDSTRERDWSFSTETTPTTLKGLSMRLSTLIRCLFNFNAALLVTGPVVLLVLQRAPDCMFKSIPSPLKTGRCNLFAYIWRWLKFWVALVFAAIAQALLVYGFLTFNPFIVHSSPFGVLASSLSLTYLSFTAILCPPTDRSQRALQRLTMLVQTYILSWILLLAGNIALNKLQIGGIYFLTGWNVALLFACVIALIERIMRKKTLNSYKKVAVEETIDRLQDSTSSLGDTTDDDLADTITEKTPLLTYSVNADIHIIPQDTSAGWWMSQAMLAIVVPVILLSHVMLLLLQSLSQTLSDGSPPIVVYSATGLLSILIIIPVTPFSAKIHQWITFVVALSFVVSATYNLTAFLFSQNAPLKIFFQQKIAVDLTSPSNGILQSITTLTGATRYLEQQVIPELPSSWGSKVTCTPSSDTLSVCEWVSPLLPSPLGTANQVQGSSRWISANVTRTSSNSARINLKGVNTRSCRLYFDNRRIKAYNVHKNLIDGLTQPSSPEVMHKGYPIPAEGLSVVQLWSRTWDRKFAVDVTWESIEDDDDIELSGRVACEWAEYENGTIGLGLPREVTGTIPAYEEVLTFLPLWAAASKVSDGLVEVYGHFSV